MSILKNKYLKYINIFLCHLIPYLLILFFVLCLCSPIWLNHAFIGGGDAYFHLNQTYEDAMQIKTGHFSYFLSMFSWNHSGRIINALYAPIFQYLMGCLLLLCKTWTNFSSVSSVLIATLCGYSMYIVCLKLHICRSYATGLACMYITSHAVLMWIGCDEFMGIGAMIIPFIFLVGIHIMSRYRINIISLTLLMSLAIQLHLLTALVGSFVIAVYTFFGFIKSKHKLIMARNGLASLLCTILASGNIIGAYINVCTHNRLIPTFFQPNMQILGSKFEHINLQTGTGFTNVYLPIYFACIIAIVLGIVLIKYENNVTRVNLGLSILFIWLSTSYFPWYKLSHHILAIAHVIQFPYRFFEYFWVPILIILGQMLTKYTKGHLHIIKALAADAIVLFFVIEAYYPSYSYTSYVGASWFRPGVVRYTDQTTYFNHSANNIRRDFNQPPLHTGLYNIQKAIPDYLPTNQKIAGIKYYHLPDFKEIDELEGNHHIKYQISTNHMKLTWYRHHGQKSIVPVVKYHDTQMVFNHHKIKNNVKINTIGVPKVHVPYGKNTLAVAYHVPAYFTVSCIMALITWIAFIIYLLIF